MTEQEWLKGNDPRPMFEYLRTFGNNRKLRMLALAVCGSIESQLNSATTEQAVRLCTHVAIGSLDAEAFRASVEIIRQVFNPVSSAELVVSSMLNAFTSENAFEYVKHVTKHVANAVEGSARDSAQRAAIREHGIDVGRHDAIRMGGVSYDRAQYQREVLTLYQAGEEAGRSARNSEKVFQCNILRDIFGNPFRRVTLDPRWLTSTVIDLARTIYEERVWERMPILADALMDAGCDSEEVINHCRGPGPHVRGCWVIDLLTGREGGLLLKNCASE
jgi:hypothetical protein